MQDAGEVGRWGRGIVLLCLTVVACAGCQTIENRFLYNPEKVWQESFLPTATELEGLDFEDVWFSSLDGTRLHGWLVEPQMPPDRSGEFTSKSAVQKAVPQNVILFAHGRGGNVGELKTRLFAFVRRHQVAVFAFDYRGYGASEGRPSEQGLYQDTEAARDWLAKRKDLDPGDVILMGHSLGAAMAIDLASRDGAKALIVQSAFTSIADVVGYHSRQVLTGKRLKSGFKSSEKIGNYSGPILISHGKADKAIPFSHGLWLAASATNASDVQFVELEGGHKSAPNEAYDAKLGEFLTELR